MSGRDGWQLCALCGEALDGDGDCGLIANAPSHPECALRAVIGGVNHLMGRCVCCGGTEPPDPPELTKREAAKAAVAFWSAREKLLREAARDACHAVGFPWFDPETGERFDPPAR